VPQFRRSRHNHIMILCTPLSSELLPFEEIKPCTLEFKYMFNPLTLSIVKPEPHLRSSRHYHLTILSTPSLVKLFCLLCESNHVQVHVRSIPTIYKWNILRIVLLLLKMVEQYSKTWGSEIRFLSLEGN
jgi:hypothetical protein